MSAPQRYCYSLAGLFVVFAFMTHVVVPEHPHPFQRETSSAAAEHVHVGEASHAHTTSESTSQEAGHRHGALSGAVLHANDKKILFTLLSTAFLMFAVGVQDLFSYIQRSVRFAERRSWTSRAQLMQGALYRFHRGQTFPHLQGEDRYDTNGLLAYS